MKSSIAEDISAINRISSVPSILRVVSEITGLRFVTIARVTGDSWTACAVLDKIDFGLQAGSELDVTTTLCAEVRDSHVPVIVNHASEDGEYCSHPTPRMYGFESYIAVPIFRVDGEYFGNVCAFDPLPARLTDEKIVSTIKLFAELISVQLQAEEKHRASETALLSERETAELREQFIAVLGHDLRNPLSSIRLGTEILLQKPLDPQALSILERMRRSCARISKLVEDVLDFARGRLGSGIPLSLREVPDLEQDLGHVVEELRGAYPDRVVDCVMEIDGSVVCDRSRVAQLFSNLLGNAFMHGAPDEPVRVLASGNSGGFSLSVTNQGAPIPSETMSRLFQPFWRPTTETSQNGGLGLGLYIAAQIARSHGGALEVSSSATTGTTFTFRLPAAR